MDISNSSECPSLMKKFKSLLLQVALTNLVEVPRALTLGQERSLLVAKPGSNA
jgi:hypothetical protein